MPLTNWLSVRFGRKRVYLVSLVVFTASSFMCGVSSTLGELILWRLVQGMGAGTLQPLAQAIFREAFPPDEQGIAMGAFGFVVLSGPAIGPTLGGWVTDNYSWPWIFFINIPIGIIGFVVAVRVLRDPPHMRGGRQMQVDGMGIGLLAVGLAALQIVLEQGETEDWFSSPFIAITAAVSALSLAGFVWRELSFDSPAVDLRILKNVPFTAGSIMGGMLGIGLFAGLFLLPQYMQLMLGFSATQAGIALMPRSLAMMAMMPVAGILFNRLGPRLMITTGLVLVAYSQWVMGHFTLQTSAVQILSPQLVQGVGFAVMFVALSTTALAGIERRKMTSATGLYNLIRQLGGSFGTALVVTLLNRKTAAARAALVVSATPYSQPFMDRWHALTGALVRRGYAEETARAAALGLIDRIVQIQAIMIAYDYIFIGIGLLFLACLPLAIFLKAPPQLPGQVETPVVE
jgi:MFS transporter, DHA2 family, multidrug resistance protein